MQYFFILRRQIAAYWSFVVSGSDIYCEILDERPTSGPFFLKFALASFAEWLMCELTFQLQYILNFSLVVKYGIDRNDIVLGRILGSGFFGEVYDGVYKKDVSILILTEKKDLKTGIGIKLKHGPKVENVHFLHQN